MSNEAELELQMAGYRKVYDYTEYSHTHHVNVIPEEDFKRLVLDTFEIIAEQLSATYGPYGASALISEQSEMIATKDGYNTFQALGFGHSYMRMVYLNIKKIIDRVNRNVGDGTTSCILLADAMFRRLSSIGYSTNDRRNIMRILTVIEKNLQDMDHLLNDRAFDKVHSLTEKSLMNLIRLSANEDESNSTLSSILYEALAPEVDENGFVTRIRNVVPNVEVTLDAESDATYSIDYLPGDYRVRVNISIDDALELSEITKIRCVIYDHSFTTADWKCFTKNWDENTPVLIIARNFDHRFLDDEWMQYLKTVKFAQRMDKGDGKPKAYLAQIQGEFVQNEIKDLSALLNTEARGLNAKEVNHDELPYVHVSVYKLNCLAFYNVKGNDISEYINKLKLEQTNGDTKSYVKMKNLTSRIDSLEMKSDDTVLNVKCGTSLESKFIMDKIDDCISIASSAITSGIVPNMLKYAWYRINKLISDNNLPLENKVCETILESIEHLFDIIWTSKYRDDFEDKLLNDTKDHFYKSSPYKSYNIITNEFVNYEKLPTSAQYDIEVVVAAISIVKYLIDGRVFIFDAHILPQVNDGGHYAQQ